MLEDKKIKSKETGKFSKPDAYMIYILELLDRKFKITMINVKMLR